MTSRWRRHPNPDYAHTGTIDQGQTVRCGAPRAIRRAPHFRKREPAFPAQGILPRSVSRLLSRSLRSRLAPAAIINLFTPTTENDRFNVYPANYKSDIRADSHAYLNNPTGIRDAAISDPALKTVANTFTRYTACLKFNAKKDGGNDYAGSKDDCRGIPGRPISSVHRQHKRTRNQTPKDFAPA